MQCLKINEGDETSIFYKYPYFDFDLSSYIQKYHIYLLYKRYKSCIRHSFSKMIFQAICSKLLSLWKIRGIKTLL